MAARETYRLERDVVEGVCSLRLEGKLDLTAAEAVEAVVRGEAGAYVLNLSGVTYMSSSGAAALVKLATSQGVQLAAPADCVRDVLTLAGLERILTLHVDEATAREACRS